MNELAKIKKIAIEAALKAGKHALKRRRVGFNISRKRGFTDLVTDADRECEALIIKTINKNFKSHSIFAEESGQKMNTAEYLWVIDPIDGTTNFAHGFPFFCTSIGVMSHGKCKVGVVYDPSKNELFVAEEGKGAYLNGKRIRVSCIGEINDSLVATGFSYNIDGKLKNMPYMERMLRNAQAVRRPGAAALDMCSVACGRFDGYWEFDLSPWDTAAGTIIVREAGGVVTTLDGKPFDIFKKELVVTNGKIHKKFLSILNAKQ